MKRARTVFLVMVPLMVLPATALASHSPGQGPKIDKVDGTGRRDSLGQTESVHVNAKSGPNGEDPSGRIRWTLQTATGTETVIAEVTCVEVTGNHADLEGVVVRSDSTVIAVGETMVASILDSGEPGTADQFGTDFGAPEFPGGRCDGTVIDLRSRGNYVVHDA